MTRYGRNRPEGTRRPWLALPVAAAALPLALGAAGPAQVAVGVGSASHVARPIAAHRPTVALAVGDFNGDRKADIVTAGADEGEVPVVLNNGGGTFSGHRDYAAGRGTAPVAAVSASPTTAPGLRR
ncbi:FG-GAP repeat domain-containing protein [Streptomyces sp. NPDC001070]